MKRILVSIICFLVLISVACLNTACQNSGKEAAEEQTSTETETTVIDEITFSESLSLPLPNLDEDLPCGQPFCFGGIVNSTSPLLSVTAVIETEDGETVINEEATYDVSENRTSAELVDITFPAEDDTSLTAKVEFESLPEGTYVFNLLASSSTQTDVLLYRSQFHIVDSEWNQLISNNLRNNYAYALRFFGSRDEFMFQYQWAEDREIIADEEWLETSFDTVVSPDGNYWSVHRKAVPYFDQAIDYLTNVYVHVDGTYESGIVSLWNLVASFDGIRNTRFVTGLRFVSHHSFGTAIDLNAVMDVCWDRLENRELIYHEVHDHLVYNGIMDDDVSYYDFTYDGDYPETFCGVPETVINYLLYELAFYRAGFSWGYYYPHICDGMHFALSEMDPDIHNTSAYSLRKVYNYIE